MSKYTYQTEVITNKPTSNKGLVPSAVEVNKGLGHYYRKYGNLLDLLTHFTQLICQIVFKLECGTNDSVMEALKD